MHVFAERLFSYLGHVISQQGVGPEPTKVDASKQIPRPQRLKQLRSFLGLTGYYRRFVPQYATVAAPLTKEHQNNFKWTEESDTSFQKLKKLLCNATVLRYGVIHLVRTHTGGRERVMSLRMPIVSVASYLLFFVYKGRGSIFRKRLRTY